MKINAVVILYHPKKSDIKNINTYAKFINKLYIFDNSENINNLPLLDELININFEYITNNQNNGISKTLNEAIRLTKNDCCDFLLTMDQDSFFEEIELIKYLNKIKEYDCLNDIGQFGINYKPEKIYQTDNIIEIVPYLITSGSIIYIPNIIKHKIYFDENLFIDSVDFDFSFQIIEKNLKNICFNNVFLEHKLGEVKMRSSFKSLYIIKKIKNIHNPLRLYYIKRNLLYLKKKYKNSLNEIKKTIKYIEYENNNHLKVSVYYADKPIKAIINIIQAYLDFRNNKFGKK